MTDKPKLEPIEKPEPEPAKAETMVSDAIKAAERLEAANEKLASLLDRQEAQQVEATLAGEATAGVKKQELTKEQKSIEEAKKYLEGTGYENILDDPESQE